MVTQTYPLLPYLFFEEGQDAIPSKYQSSEGTAEFSESELPKATLPIYYRMLDVIGSRMQKNAGAQLIVIGATDGQEKSSAADRKSLATRRANSVSTYLQTRWNIAPNRFVVKVVDKPTLVSNEKYDEGNQENRRVELSSNDATITGPVLHTRFLEWVPVQPVHNFSVNVTNPQVAVAWQLEVDHNKKPISSVGADGAPPGEVAFSLDQKMTDQLGPIVTTQDELQGVLTIRQNTDSNVIAQTMFPIHKSVSKYEVSRLSLIVFDYDRSDITDVNKEMMRKVVSSAVGPGSSATIKGSTDRLGEISHNVELSTSRAKSVQAFVKTIVPQLKIDDVRGIGASDLPYDNNLPEGRFYCRTVSLIITTPLR